MAGSLVTRLSDGAHLECDKLLSLARRQWSASGRADARAFLQEHADQPFPTIVHLDFALEEYLFRVEQGESLDIGEFCERFPTIAKSLRKCFELQELLLERPDLAESFPKPGEQFAECQILRELGRGAASRVYLAEEQGDCRRHVVLKVTASGVSDEAGILSRFFHPHIAVVYAVKRDPASGLRALCMAYQASATLFDALQWLFADGQRPRQGLEALDAIEVCQGGAEAPARSALPAAAIAEGSYDQTVAHWGRALADALACVHRDGVCHGDLKPSNILLTRSGEPLLADFNLSFLADDAERIEGGTLPYMAPEALGRLFDLADLPQGAPEASDIFSLGVVLYEALTGKHPFLDFPASIGRDERARFAAALAEAQRWGPVPLFVHDPAIPQFLAVAVLRCLSWDPQERPTAGELARLLTPLPDEPSDDDAPRSASLARRAAWAAGLLTVIALAGMVWRSPGPHVSAAAATAPASREAATLLREGEALLQRGDFAAAEVVFARAWREHDSLEALQGKARAGQLAGNYTAAALDYAHLAGETGSGDWHACAAYCAAMANDHPKAAFHGYEALRRDCDTPVVRLNHAYSLIKTQHLGLALNECQRALESDPASPLGRYLKGLAQLIASLQTGNQAAERHALGQIEQIAQAGEIAPELILYVARHVASRPESPPEGEAEVGWWVQLAFRHGLPPLSEAKFYREYPVLAQFKDALQIPPGSDGDSDAASHRPISHLCLTDPQLQPGFTRLHAQNSQ